MRFPTKAVSCSLSRVLNDQHFAAFRASDRELAGTVLPACPGKFNKFVLTQLCS